MGKTTLVECGKVSLVDQMVKRLRRGVENVLITKTIRVCDAESHRKAHARTSISFATEEVLELPWDHGLRFGVESTREQRHTYIRLGKTVGARRYEQFFSYIRIQPGPADDPLPCKKENSWPARQTILAFQSSGCKKGYQPASDHRPSRWEAPTSKQNSVTRKKKKIETTRKIRREKLTVRRLLPLCVYTAKWAIHTA